jgi:hypothetical protein
MTGPQTENSPVLEEASRELQAAAHDAQVAFDCIALGELDRAHTHALTAKVAADAAVTALAAELGQPDLGQPELGRPDLDRPDLDRPEPGQPALTQADGS